MYNYTRNQAIAKKKQQEADRNRAIIYMIIIFMIIASAILFHLYHRSKIKKQKELQLLNQKFTGTNHSRFALLGTFLLVRQRI